MKTVVQQLRDMITSERVEVENVEKATKGTPDAELSTKAYKAFYAKDWFMTKVAAVSVMTRTAAWYAGLSGFQEMVMGLALNDDHFGDCGRQTWTMGHTVAWEHALAAAKTQSRG